MSERRRHVWVRSTGRQKGDGVIGEEGVAVEESIGGGYGLV
jgi:hypothetical protein